MLFHTDPTLSFGKGVTENTEPTDPTSSDENGIIKKLQQVLRRLGKFSTLISFMLLLRCHLKTLKIFVAIVLFISKYR